MSWLEEKFFLPFWWKFMSPRTFCKRSLFMKMWFLGISECFELIGKKVIFNYFCENLQSHILHEHRNLENFRKKKKSEKMILQGISFEQTDVQKRATIHFRELQKSFPKLICNDRFDDEKPLYKRKKTDAHLAWLEIGFCDYKNL